MRIKSSKKAIYKSQDPESGKTEEKNEDKKRKNGGRKDKSPKKPRTENNEVDNKYVSRYTNYTPLNPPIDHIFAMGLIAQEVPELLSW